jgi:hypothetical protein
MKEAWFPGRWIGGAALLVAPLLMLTGVLLRVRFPFFFPHQLEAFAQHPSLIAAAYSCFLAGNILLWPAILTLARFIGITRLGWAQWGASLTLFGLFARTFHAGIDHLAFQLARAQGVRAATEFVAGSYGAFHVVSTLNAAIVFGWIVLAVGAYRAGVLGAFRSICLGLMALLMLGSLKGTSPTSVLATAGLCVALAPLGVKVLAERPAPSASTVLSRLFFAIAFLSALFWLGQRG